MVTKRTPDLPSFGKYLFRIRKEASIKSRFQAAEMLAEGINSGEKKFSGLMPLTPNQISKDEKGLIFDIPPDRLKAYSVLYKVPYEEIIARLAEEKYKVQFATGLLWEGPDFEAYKILRFLLDTRKYQKVLAGLQLLVGGIETKIQEAANPGKDGIWEMASEREEADGRKNS